MPRTSSREQASASGNLPVVRHFGGQQSVIDKVPEILAADVAALSPVGGVEEGSSLFLFEVAFYGPMKDFRDTLPDARDGLTRRERIVLHVLHETQRERGGRSVPTTMLWGRVCEHFHISPEALSEMLARLGARNQL